MKRKDWEFSYPIATIRDGAEEQAHYHRGRQEHWEGRQEKAEADLREHGIEIVHHQVTGGVNAQAVLDPEKAKHLSDCQSKIETHRRQAEEYENWVYVLTMEIDQGNLGILWLHADDVLYFLGEH